MADEDELLEFYDRTILNTLERHIDKCYRNLRGSYGYHRNELLDEIILYEEKYKELSGDYYYR